MTRRLALAGLVLALIPLAALAGGIPAGPNVAVTDAGLAPLEDAAEPVIAAQGGSLYAAWLDTRGGSSTERPIYFARSDDSGASWSANKRANLLSYTGFTNRPALSVAPDGSIWIAWWLQECFSISGECGGVDRSNDTRLALSTDGGQTFGEYLVYDAGAPNGEIDGFPEIHAEDDRTLLLTYAPAGDGVNVVLRILARSGPGTLATTTVPVSSGSGSGRLVDGIIPDGPAMSLAVRGATVCAAWEDSRERFAIFGACSTDRGDSFGPNFAISGSDDFSPRLAFGPDGTLYAAYQDVAGGPVLVRRSTDNGASWDTPTQAFGLDSGLKIDSYDLDVDPSGQLLLTVPVRSGSGFSSKSDLFLATSIDRGQRFALGAPLEDGQGEFPTVSTQAHPHTAIGGGPQGARAYVIWSDDRNSQEQIWSARLDLDSGGASAPANLQAQGGDGSILLTWGAASDPSGVAGYHVLRATGEGGPFTQITPRLVTATGYRDVGLDGTPYFYRVFAVDGTGNPGPPSNTATATASVGGGLGALSGTIAYEAGENLAVRSFAGAGLGEQRVLGQATLPAFTHDGQRLLSVVNAAGAGAVLSRSPEGGDAQPLYTAETLISDVDPTADPNLLGVAEQQSYLGPNICLAFEPRVRSLAPGQQLYGVDYTLATDMAVSSDRTLLAYTYKNWCNGLGGGVYDSARLCVANTQTGQETCLDGADAGESDFVPGRATLVFAASFTGQRELWSASVGPDGSLANFAQLTRGPAGQPASAPRVSTDGTWVIFERDLDPGAGENPVLHVVRLDGDGLRSLGVQGEAPAWAGGGPAPAPVGRAPRAYVPLVRR